MAGTEATQKQLAKSKDVAPWDRLPDEGDAPFAAFREFLHMAKPRDLQVVAKRLGKAYQTVRRYSSAHNWAGRAKAWDAHEAKAEDRVVISERERMVRDQLRVLEGMRGLGTSEIARRIRLAKADPDGDYGISARDAIALVEKSIQLERLILGDATARHEVGVKKIDLSPLNAEEAEALLALLKKVGAIDDS